MVMENLKERWYPKLFHSSAFQWKGKHKTNDVMKIPVEAVCIMISSDSKVYDYQKIYSLFYLNTKNIGCKLKLLYFI